jgi:hypothetical protein
MRTRSVLARKICLLASGTRADHDPDSAHQVADYKYYEDGFKILELASRAYELYTIQTSEQKTNFSKFYFRTAR